MEDRVDQWPAMRAGRDSENEDLLILRYLARSASLEGRRLNAGASPRGSAQRQMPAGRTGHAPSASG